MPPQYISTRGESPPLSFCETIAAGLAPDGGLFVPEQMPRIDDLLSAPTPPDYSQLCFEFLRRFADDIPPAQLRQLVDAAYRSFNATDIAPLRRLDEHRFVLELFHGPTLAFKDFALQLLGNLYEAQIQRTNSSLNILGATSGDTGSAAIHGLLGKKDVNAFILYPAGRISALQERQMTCTSAANIFPIAINGTFDDAQRIVKALLGNTAFKTRYRLSAVNSINIARILAQSVYYIYAWLRLPSNARKNVEFVVPTGNFGNILAGWWAQKMGLPVRSFKIATNSNDILYRLFTTGRYEKEPAKTTHAPSMDIQAASNFERFLYYAEGSDPANVRRIMTALQQTGHYHFDSFEPDTFTTSRATDEDILHLIRETHQKYNYLVDPHTACGFKDLHPKHTSIILATAHPAKFPNVIQKALKPDTTIPPPTHTRLEALKKRPIQRYSLPAETNAVRHFIIQNATPPS